MSIREEFEKWFKAQYPFDCAPNLMEHNIAERAAKWMAERLAKEIESLGESHCDRFCTQYSCDDESALYVESIRKLAQELSR